MSRAKEPTRAQFNSRLAYAPQQTPAFLQRLKARVEGHAPPDSSAFDDEFDEWEATSGREPIPRRPEEERDRRPSPPSRPEGEKGSEDEDDQGEKPQLVVLKEGKHLSEREVENEKRRARGLSPLRDDEDIGQEPPDEPKQNSKMKDTPPSLNFSSGGFGAAKSKKRKLGAISEREADGLEELVNREKPTSSKADEKRKDAKIDKKIKKAKTKAKTGALLSFVEDG